MWTADRTCEILGTRFRIQTEAPDVAAGIDVLLAPFFLLGRSGVRSRDTFSLVDGASLDPPRPNLVVAFRDSRQIASGPSWAPVVTHLLAALNRAVVEGTPHFAAHAGVLAGRDGAIALPASSGGGKSTVTAACVQAGFRYVSDEALCVDVDSAQVIPYPKPFGLSKWSRQRLGAAEELAPFPPGEEEAIVPPDAFGGVADGRLDLAHVVLSEYGHEGVSLVEIPGSEVMAAVLRFSFNHYKLGERAFHLVARLANQSTAWRLSYGDPIEAASVLRETLG